MIHSSSSRGVGSSFTSWGMLLADEGSNRDRALLKKMVHVLTFLPDVVHFYIVSSNTQNAGAQQGAATNSSSRETKVGVNEDCVIRAIGSTRAKHQLGPYILYLFSVHIRGVIGNLCFSGVNQTTTSPLGLSRIGALLYGPEILC